MNIKLILSYDGTRYQGWQKNRELPTIEGALEKALFQILRHDVALQAASRTDAGVHAQGQVVNFYTAKELDLDRLRYSLNGVLPSDIRVHNASIMPEAFHPTLDNLGKEYVYQICTAHVQLPFNRHHSWHFPYPIDCNAMQEASASLLGTHDFSAFCNERALWDRSPICTLHEIRIEPLPHGRLQIIVRGDHFLYKMVRNLVGTLLYVGCGKISAASMIKVLDEKDRALAGVTAPAHGLCLNKVFY